MKKSSLETQNAELVALPRTKSSWVIYIRAVKVREVMSKDMRNQSFMTMRNAQKAIPSYGSIPFTFFSPTASPLHRTVRTALKLSIPDQAASTMGYDQRLSSKKSRLTQISSSDSKPNQDESDCTTRESGHERETYQPPEVAKQEEANIIRAKILVALIIVVAASGVATSTYILLKDQEKTNFENQ
eukprot:scaffold26053_cov127-Cylindrotheca_fusiformis.AAC.2